MKGEEKVELKKQKHRKKEHEGRQEEAGHMVITMWENTKMVRHIGKIIKTQILFWERDMVYNGPRKTSENGPFPQRIVFF